MRFNNAAMLSPHLCCIILYNKIVLLLLHNNFKQRIHNRPMLPRSTSATDILQQKAIITCDIPIYYAIIRTYNYLLAAGAPWSCG